MDCQHLVQLSRERFSGILSNFHNLMTTNFNPDVIGRQVATRHHIMHRLKRFWLRDNQVTPHEDYAFLVDDFKKRDRWFHLEGVRYFRAPIFEITMSYHGTSHGDWNEMPEIYLRKTILILIETVMRGHSQNLFEAFFATGVESCFGSDEPHGIGCGPDGPLRLYLALLYIKSDEGRDWLAWVFHELPVVEIDSIFLH